MKPGNHYTLYRLVPIPTRQGNVLKDEEEDRSGRKLFLKGRVFLYFKRFCLIYER